MTMERMGGDVSCSDDSLSLMHGGVCGVSSSLLRLGRRSAPVGSTCARGFSGVPSPEVMETASWPQHEERSLTKTSACVLAPVCVPCGEETSRQSCSDPPRTSTCPTMGRCFPLPSSLLWLPSCNSISVVGTDAWIPSSKTKGTA